MLQPLNLSLGFFALPLWPWYFIEEFAGLPYFFSSGSLTVVTGPNSSVAVIDRVTHAVAWAEGDSQCGKGAARAALAAFWPFIALIGTVEIELVISLLDLFLFNKEILVVFQVQKLLEIRARWFFLGHILLVGWTATAVEAVLFVQIQHLGPFFGSLQISFFDLKLQSNYLQSKIEQRDPLVDGVKLLSVLDLHFPHGAVELLLHGLVLLSLFFELEG